MRRLPQGLNIKSRLLANRDITIDGCWLWTGCKQKDGYGIINYEGKSTLVHRLAAFIFLGLELDSKLCALHRLNCRNRDCFNPEHLYIGTHDNNMKDLAVLKTHCPGGHEYTPDNTYVGKHNDKNCKICHNLRNLANYYRNKKLNLGLIQQANQTTNNKGE